MIYRKQIALGCITLAVAGPVLPELRPALECDIRTELCGLSDAAYLPDEPAPEHAPLAPVVQPVAGYTVSLSSGVVIMPSVPDSWR